MSSKLHCYRNPGIQSILVLFVTQSHIWMWESCFVMKKTRLDLAVSKSVLRADLNQSGRLCESQCPILVSSCLPEMEVVFRSTALKR